MATARIDAPRRNRVAPSGLPLPAISPRATKTTRALRARLRFSWSLGLGSCSGMVCSVKF